MNFVKVLQMKDKEYSKLMEIVKVAEELNSKDEFDLGEIRNLMNNQMCIRVISRNKRIFRSDQRAEYVYLVIRGSFFNYRISEGGRMHILGRGKAPEWLGIDRAVNLDHVNCTENRTLEECVVLEIKTAWFLEVIQNNGEFALYIIRNILNKMTDISGKSDRLLFHDAREHLIFYILKYWNENRHGKEICRITMKNEIIAEEMGISVRTLYRVQCALKEEGLIDVKKGDIVVTLAQIHKMETFVPYYVTD